MASFDFSRYQWRRDENTPTLFKREIGAGELIEDVWNFHKQGEQNLFLGLYATLSRSIDAAGFVALARKAWISTRWDIPTVASQILHVPREGSPPVALLVYTLPSSFADVEAWAGETVALKDGVKDLDELRFKVGQGILPTKDLEPQTFIYCVSFSPTAFGILFRTSHVPFDGAGLKIVGTTFLEHLSKYIAEAHYADTETVRFKWGTEGGHLLPIASEILRTHEPALYDDSGNVTKVEVPDEPREGPKYLETLNEVMEGLAKGGSIAHPFKSLIQPLYDPTKSTPSNRRASHTFSLEESKKIITAGSQLGPDRLTVNNLAHGALSLLTVLDNPPAPGSPNVVFYYGLVDSRQRLAKEYRGVFAYPGYCLGVSAIQIPVALADKYGGDIEKNLKAAILDFAQAVKAQYKRQTEFPSLLAIGNQQVELMLSVPPPPPWCGPWFAGDGRGATYLRPSYPQEEEKVIEITDFFLGLNKTDPGPFFRATEWNGRVMLSADYNERAVEPSVVNGWMKKWAELLLAVAC